MADEKKDKEGEAKAKSKAAILDNKVILLGGIVVVQAILAIALTQFVIMPRLGQQAAAASAQTALQTAKTPEIGVLVSLNEVIVTLQSDGAAPRYLRTTVDLEVSDQATANIVAARLPMLRDAVIMTISQRSAAQLITPEGKKGLRDELTRRLADKLPADSLRDIYFSDLVIQ